MVVLAGGIVTGLPRRRSGPSAAIAQRGHGLVPGQLATVADELLPPVLVLRVATGVDELLIIAIGHFRSIDVVGLQGVGTDPADERDHVRPVAALDEVHTGGRALL